MTQNPPSEDPPSATTPEEKRQGAHESAPSAESVFGGPPPQDLADVARLLGLSRKGLSYMLFRAPDDRRYASFEIPKRTGGMRRIDSPIGLIRLGQERLAPMLTALHRPHPASHGFLPGRSVLTNAESHLGQRLVLNVDLADFFPSINFGRIRGLFRAAPFHMGDAAATVCAQLCTFRNGLPQGAPTSPALSNFIASGLDRRLQKLARQNRARYSRYADDITFSTGASAFPASICAVEGDAANAPVVAGPELEVAIASAGFAINPKKVRLQRRHVRQAVTGVTVNEKPNVDRKRVRRIRGMIHAWRKFGLEAAGEAHWRLRGFQRGPASDSKDRVFRNALYGELAYLKMLRGEEDSIYRKFAAQLLELDANPPKSLRRQLFGADDFEVFISHASEDKETVARPLWEACEKAGIKAFLDQVDIQSGERFAAKINMALGAARLVLAVVTETALRKEWPLAEINTALGLEVEGEKTVYALVVGRPDLSQLPLLRQKKYRVWKNDPEAVAAEVKALLSGDAETGERPQSRRRPTRNNDAAPWDAPEPARRSVWASLFRRRR